MPGNGENNATDDLLKYLSCVSIDDQLIKLENVLISITS